MSSDDDRWPMPLYLAPDRDQTHALGVITLNYNNFEFGLFRLFSHHFERKGMGIELPWQLYSALNDNKKPVAVRAVFRLFESDPVVVEHVEHVIAIFHCCETNRNHLFHSVHDASSPDDILRLFSGVKGAWEKLNVLEIPLPRLRKIADDMFEGWQYFFEVWGYLQRRDKLITIPDFLHGMLPVALPQKPPLPDTLNPSQNPRARPAPDSLLPEYEP